jgi:HD-GYP domain-containing protein (c-di-GMP phosphodiesterase class II)
MAKVLGLSAEDRSDIRFGGFIHDIGKIGISESILNKKEALTTEERGIIRQHSRWSGEVAEMAGLHPGIVNVALYHHERFDGMGYPGGLTGEDIPLLARIASIADVYDAISLDRPYRKGMEPADVLEYLLSERGRAFDSEITNLFVSEMKKSKGKPKIILARPKVKSLKSDTRSIAAGE